MQSKTLTLYHSPDSCARAAHLALEEAGANYEAVKMSLAAGDQRKPEYLAINPKGRVPALVTAQGVLTETPAILTYIAQLRRTPSLPPRSSPSTSIFARPCTLPMPISCAARAGRTTRPRSPR
jgi:glutathione S-transferase